MPGSEAASLRGPLEGIMREAGELARATARTTFKRWTKGDDNSPVSEGDIAVNDLLRARLSALAPAAGWLSEETEDSLPARAMRLAWIVDPIDGTRAYISGRADWTISVALVEDGRPQLAAHLRAGYGRNVPGGARARRHAQRRAHRGQRGRGLGGAKLAGPKRYLDRLSGLNPQIAAQPKVFSLALRFARVAHGELDAAFASPGSHDWDLAAADLLVHEAGGVMTDFSGGALAYNRPHVVHGALIAAGSARHGTLIDLVRGRMAEFA